MPTTETVYNDRDNTIDLLLTADGNPQDLSAVTRMVLSERNGAFEIDSGLASGVFDWDTGFQGKVVLVLGHQGIAVGTYACSLIVYDPTNNDGIHWGQIMLKVIE